jgi:hypothetical protein
MHGRPRQPGAVPPLELETLQVSDHAEFSPSSLHRVIACPASYQASIPFRDDEAPPGEAAERGTIMHAAFESAMRNLSNFSELSDDERGLTLDALAAVGDWLTELKDVELYLEEHMPVGQFLGLDDPDLCWGTADLVAVTSGALYVVDLKTGRWPVTSEENIQLLAYLLGAIHRFGTRRAYQVGIIQPPVSKAIQWWEVNPQSIVHHAGRLVSAIEAALGDAPEFRPGDSQCKWCPANGSCAHHARWALEDDFGPPTSILTPEEIGRYRWTTAADLANKPETRDPPAPDTLTPEEIGHYLDREDAIKTFFDALRKRAIELQIAGTAIPGQKLVHKQTRERWLTGPEDLAEAFEARGLPVPDLMPRTPLSPAQAAKLVGKAKLEGLTIKPEGQLTTAPIADRRKAVTAGEFDAC